MHHIIAGPLVDEQPSNPFYCPDIPAISFIDTLRRQLYQDVGSPRQTSTPYRIGKKLLLSYARNLDRALFPRRRQSKVSISHPELVTEPNSRVSLWDDSSTLGSHRGRASGLFSRDSIKHKQISSSPLSFNDIGGQIEHVKSYQSVHESSFEVEIRSEKLNYARPGSAQSSVGYLESILRRQIIDQASVDRQSTVYDLKLRIQNFEEELYATNTEPQTTDSITALIAHLDFLLPGIRLKERLLGIIPLTHQKIADHLAQHGLLNNRVLNALRHTDIGVLSLTSSLVPENGLNISGNEVLRVFTRPHSFRLLSELFLSDTPLDDYDLVHVHHLPNLSILHLDNTGIGNEAICHLVSLKHSLTELYISGNPNIDDDAMYALALLPKLFYLSMVGTSIGMPGLRKFFVTTYRLELRLVTMEIPSPCARYLATLESKYVVQPSPELIVDPSLCASQPSSILKFNLVQHAARNPNIAISGTRVEMARRLEEILRIREADLLVRGSVWMGRSDVRRYE